VLTAHQSALSGQQGASKQNTYTAMSLSSHKTAFIQIPQSKACPATADILAPVCEYYSLYIVSNGSLLLVHVCFDAQESGRKVKGVNT